MRKKLGFLPVKERQFCIILLSEVPITVGEFGVADFKLVPMSTPIDFFKPYGLLLYVPAGFDFLTAPLFAEALAPILSFSLRRRVKAHRASYDTENPPKQLDKDVSIRLPSVSVGPEASLQQRLSKEEQYLRIKTFVEIYETLMKMGEKEYLAAMRALHLYQLSLLNYREDIGLAYTLLVASIESVAQGFLDIGFSYDDLGDSEEWDRTFAELGISEPHLTCIRNKLVEKAHFLGLRFRRFIEKYLPDSFWVSPDSRAKELDDYIEELTKEHFGEKEDKSHFESYWWLYTPERKVTKNELDDVLKSIYELRSRFAHRGISPPSEVVDHYETAEIKWEMDNEGRVQYRRAIPSYFWFEKVVHESVSNLLRQKLSGICG
jgi:hypothetical protein